MSLVIHGKATTYTNHRCRCEACRRAASAYHKSHRERRADRLNHDPTLADHGTVDTYANWGCRCAFCTNEWAAYRRERREAGMS